jgi:hypothetical protein
MVKSAKLRHHVTPYDALKRFATPSVAFSGNARKTTQDAVGKEIEQRKARK